MRLDRAWEQVFNLTEQVQEKRRDLLDVLDVSEARHVALLGLIAATDQVQAAERDLLRLMEEDR